MKTAMTQEEISEKLFNLYGFRVPPDFAEILLLAYEDSWHPDGYYSSEGFQAYLQSFLAFEGDLSRSFMTDSYVWRNEFYEQTINRNLCYSNLPFEFFPFGEDEELGKLFGFIVHTPQLTAENLPIGECSVAAEMLEYSRYKPIFPRELPVKVSSPINEIGNDTQSAFEYIFQRKLQKMSDDFSESANRELIYERKMALDKANQTMALRGKKLSENYVPPNLQPPPISADWHFDPFDWDSDLEWHFEPTKDGIGVIAPRQLFWEIGLFDAPRLKTVEEDIDFIRGYLGVRFPATALRMIRDIYWEKSHIEGYFARIAPLWAEIYEALNRPILAKRVKTALEYRK